MSESNYRKFLKPFLRNTVRLTIGGGTKKRTRFGGRPDVPANFVWPYCGNDPLAFLLQLDCRDLAGRDPEHLLPEKGLLSFFFDMSLTSVTEDDFDGTDGFRVYLFEEAEILSPADFPEDLDEDYRYPVRGIRLKKEKSLPDFDEYQILRYGDSDVLDVDEMEEYWEACMEMGTFPFPEDDAPDNRLLGWPMTVQGNMTWWLEKARRIREGEPPLAREEIRRTLDDWVLLLQFHGVEDDDFYGDFAEDGTLFFYIRREDLARRDFTRVRLEYQCG